MILAISVMIAGILGVAPIDARLAWIALFIGGLLTVVGVAI